MNRTAILERLQSELREGNHIIGVSTGTGITAKVAADSGADFILMLNSGKFRQMGRSSLAGFLPFCNSNEMVMDFASKEIVPLVRDTPVLFGLNANDPTREMSLYIEEIKARGFAGVNNYPTVGLIDGGSERHWRRRASAMTGRWRLYVWLISRGCSRWPSSSTNPKQSRWLKRGQM